MGIPYNNANSIYESADNYTRGGTKIGIGMHGEWMAQRERRNEIRTRWILENEMEWKMQEDRRGKWSENE